MTHTITVSAQEKKTRPPAYGGTLTWGVTHKPTGINPVYTTYSVSMSLLDLLFNGLVRWNPQGEIEPDLAEKWDISPDGLDYTFHLRQGVRFHDGKECTARDVKFTYDTILDEKNKSPFRTLFSIIKEITIIDPYTVRFTLRLPSVDFIELAIKEIMPAHGFKEESPVGTGPFRFQSWDTEGTITLSANPDYFEGRPFLDTIIVKTYETSQGLWTALMRGEVDFVLFLEKEDYEIIKTDPAFKTFAIPADGYYALVYNINDPLLADIDIRRALSFAIDCKDIIERAAGGYGFQATGPFHPESLGFNPEVKAFSYAPGKAQNILKEKGWVDEDNDGIREKGGKEFVLNVLVDSRNQIYKTIAMILRQQLQAVGIKLKVILYDDERVLTREFIEHHRPQGHLKLMPGNTLFNIREDWATNQFRGADKLWIYTNPEVTRLFKQGEILREKEKRKIIYQRIHRLVYEDQPAYFLYFRNDFHAISAQFNNVKKFFTLSMPYYTMKDWYREK